MRLYDIVVLVTPDLSDEEATKVAGEYKKILTDGGATVVKDEPWGKRRLAFPIQRKREAHYVYWQVDASPAAVAEAERESYEESVGRAVEALRLWLTHGIDAAMRRANVLPSSPDRLDPD